MKRTADLHFTLEYSGWKFMFQSTRREITKENVTESLNDELMQVAQLGPTDVSSSLVLF